MWELPCTLPGLVAGSSLACFSSSTLDSQCTALASPLPQAGSGEVSLERKGGMALAQGLGEVREGPLHPSFLPFEIWFCPLKPFRTNSDTASCNHTCVASRLRKKAAFSIALLFSRFTQNLPGHQIPLHSPSSASSPAQRTTAGSKHTLLHPNTSTEHVPMPPTPTVVQRPRAELVCT